MYDSLKGSKYPSKESITKHNKNSCDNFMKFTELDAPIQCKNDERSYSIIKLSNDMVFLLISDSQIKEACVAVKVMVGSTSEPKEFSGLAHFLEHMLFLGSKPYPSPEEYDQFFTKNGGESDACTDDEKTIYKFQTKPEALYEGMQRTAEFFISPTFNENYTNKELKTIDSEFALNKEMITHIYDQSLKNFSNKNSFYNIFTDGDEKSLKKKGVINALLKFHKEFYSANLMRGVILSNHNIETLKKYTTEIWSRIENKNIDPPSFKDYPLPFDDTSRGKLLL